MPNCTSKKVWQQECFDERYRLLGIVEDRSFLMSATAAKLVEKYPRVVRDHAPPANRMTFSDVEEDAGWITAKMQKRTKLASVQGVKTWLRSCIAANDLWFMKSGLAVGMAQLVREPLKSPRAEEIFVFCKDGGEADGADLYINMAMWANRLDCVRLDVDLWSDVPKPEIVARLGRLRDRVGSSVWF